MYVLTGCAAVLLMACQPGQNEAVDPANASVAERTIAVAAAEVQSRDLSRRLILSATVQPLQTVQLAAQTRGIVRDLHVEIGDFVEQGEPLLSLDQAEQRAELARAEAVLEQAKLAYQRQSELYSRQLTSSAEYQAQAAELRVAESEYQLWQTRVGFGDIVAPRQAVVSRRWVELGESIREQDPLLELTDMSQLVLHLGVSELDVAHLSVGQQVDVTLDAMPEQPVIGHIRRVFPTAELNSRFITVEIALPATAYQQGIRPGYLARVNLMIDAREQALAVPASALVKTDEHSYVMLIKDDRLIRQDVTTGVHRGQWLEITSGIQAGDVVLAAQAGDMNEGQRVRIVGWRG